MRDRAWGAIGALAAVVFYAATQVVGRGYEVREAWLLVLPLVLLVAAVAWIVALVATRRSIAAAPAAALLLGMAAGAIMLSLLAPGQAPQSEDGAPSRRLEVALVWAFTAGPLLVAYRAARRQAGQAMGAIGSLLVLFAALVAVRNALLFPTEAAAAAVAAASFAVLAVWVAAALAARTLPRRWRRAAA